MGWRRFAEASVEEIDTRDAGLGAHAVAALQHWFPTLALVAVLVGGLAVAFTLLGYPSLALPVGGYFVGMLVILALVELKRFFGDAAHRRSRSASALGRALTVAESKGWVVRSHLGKHGLENDHLLIADDRIVLLTGVTIHGEWRIANGGIPIAAGDPVPSVRARARAAKRLAVGSDPLVVIDTWLVIDGSGRGRATPAHVKDVLVLRPRDLAKTVAGLPVVDDIERRDGWVTRVDGFAGRVSTTAP